MIPAGYTYIADIKELYLFSVRRREKGNKNDLRRLLLLAMNDNITYLLSQKRVAFRII